MNILTFSFFFLLLFSGKGMCEQKPKDDTVLEWVKDNKSKIDNFKSYAALDKIAERSTFLGLGEGDHGLHEQTQMRIPFTKYLVEEKGYRIITMESGFLEGQLVNRYIQGELDEFAVFEDIIEGFTHEMGAWQEQKDLINWLKDWNQKNLDDKVHFYGLDEPVTGSSLYYVAESIQGELLGNISSEEIKKVFSDLKVLLKKGNRLFEKAEEVTYRLTGSKHLDPDFLDAIVFFSFTELSETEQDSVFKKIEELIEYSSNNIKEGNPQLHQNIMQLSLIENSIKLRLEKPWNPFNVKVAKALGIEYNEPDNIGDPDVLKKLYQDYQDQRRGKEQLLLANLLWAQNEFSKKTIMFAHNGHLSKSLVDGGEYGISAGLGFLLFEEVAENYNVIATTMNHFINEDGSIANIWHGVPVINVEDDPESLEYYLSKASEPSSMDVLFFDFKNAPTYFDNPVKMRFSTRVIDTAVSASYDGLIYFPEVHRAIPLVY